MFFLCINLLNKSIGVIILKINLFWIKFNYYIKKEKMFYLKKKLILKKENFKHLNWSFCWSNFWRWKTFFEIFRAILIFILFSLIVVNYHFVVFIIDSTFTSSSNIAFRRVWHVGKLRKMILMLSFTYYFILMINRYTRVTSVDLTAPIIACFVLTVMIEVVIVLK